VDPDEAPNVERVTAMERRYRSGPATF